MMLQHYFPAGMLGLGLCALMASFMSGMAGNTTAFNTVWTYDIYQSYIKPNASDAHYLAMGRAATVFGIAISVAAAFVARQFNNIMDLLQLVFAFVNAPLFATFMLGMFWKRATGHGAFIGLLSGTLAAALHHGMTLPLGAAVGFKGGFLGSVVHTYPSEMAQNFWTAIFAWTTCLLVTIFVSLFTEPRRDADLTGLVYSLTPVPQDRGLPWHKRPGPAGDWRGRGHDRLESDLLVDVTSDSRSRGSHEFGRPDGSAEAFDEASSRAMDGYQIATRNALFDVRRAAGGVWSGDRLEPDVPAALARHQRQPLVWPGNAGVWRDAAVAREAQGGLMTTSTTGTQRHRGNTQRTFGLSADAPRRRRTPQTAQIVLCAFSVSPCPCG